MDIQDNYRRLLGLWGRIDRQHNQVIAATIPPRSTVLDIGCGYGSLVHELCQQGIDAQGVEIDPEAVRLSKTLYGDLPITLVNAEDIHAFPDASFDVVVLKDAFHHVYNEHDYRKSFGQFWRILKPGGRLIIFDPNPMFILRLARKLIRHVDPEAARPVAEAVLREFHFEIGGVQYYEVIGLPLSGGFVGPVLVPNWRPAHSAVAALNHGLSRLFAVLGLGSSVCWRYCLWGVKPANSSVTN